MNRLISLATMVACSGTIVGSVFAQEIPFPPRCGPYSVQSVSTNGDSVSIAVAVPTQFESGKKIAGGTRISLDVLQSLDGGQTYERTLEVTAGGSVSAVENQPSRLDATVKLSQLASDDAPVFLAVRVRVGDQASQLAMDYLSFRLGDEDDIVRFRAPSDAMRATEQPETEGSLKQAYLFSEQQADLIKRFGQPDFFEIAWIRRDEGETDQIKTHRLERWYYLAWRTEFRFFNGQCIASNEFDGSPQVQTEPLYEPTQFSFSSTVEQIEQVAGDHEVIHANLKEMGFTAELLAKADLYFAKGLAVGFQDNQLCYVRSSPNWPSRSPIDSNHRTSLHRLPSLDRTGEQSCASLLPWGSTINRTTVALGTSGLAPMAVTWLSSAPQPLDPNGSAGPYVDLVATSVGAIAIGSVLYGIYSYGQDSADVGGGVLRLGRIYTATNEALDHEERRISTMLESGTLSQAEHQRLSGKLRETREALTELRDELVEKQAKLTGIAFVRGVINLASTHSTLGTGRSDVRNHPADVLISSGAGITVGNRPSILTNNEVIEAFNRAENRISAFNRDRYHQRWVHEHVMAHWTRWDVKVSRGNMTDEQRTQKFYELVDQLDRDGWHVRQGIENLAVETVSNMPGFEDGQGVPPARRSTEATALVCRGYLSEQSTEALEQLLLAVSRSFDFLGGDDTVKAEVRSDQFTLTVSPDKRASISTGQIHIDFTYASGEVTKTSATLAFDTASDDAIVLSRDPRPGEMLPIRSITGTGRVQSQGTEVTPFDWKVEYAGMAIWKVTMTFKKPEEMELDAVPDQMIFKLDLEEVHEDD